MTEHSVRPPDEGAPTSASPVALLSGRAGQYLLIGLAVALVVASLFLPPVSLGNRLFHWDVPLVRADEGGSVAHLSGTSLQIAPGTMQGDARILIEAYDASGTDGVVSADSIMQVAQNTVLSLPDEEELSAALAQLPQDVTLYSPFYRVRAYSEIPAGARLAVSLPYEIAPVALADLYAWDGNSWQWLPAHASEDGLSLETTRAAYPGLFAIGTPQDSRAIVGVTLSGQDLEQVADADLPASITLQGWRLEGNGEIVGDAPERSSLTVDPGQVLVSLSNLEEGVVRSDLLDNMLIDPASLSNHVKTVAARVVSEGFDGVELMYVDVNADLGAEFTVLVQDMAAALKEEGKLLAIRLPAPLHTLAGWETGAYDWASIGAVADIVRFAAPVAPSAYGPGGEMEQLASWAVGEVQRSRLELVASAFSVDSAADASESITYENALQRLTANIEVEDPSDLVMPGQTVRLGANPSNQRSLELDAASQMNWFEYSDDDGAEHVVWMENARSLVRKLQVAERFGLRGAVLDGALAEGNDSSVLPLVATWSEDLIPPDPEYAVLWQVQDTDGNTFRTGMSGLDDVHFAWLVPDRPGQYEIEAAISDDGGLTSREVIAQVAVQVPSPTPSPTPEPTNTPEPTATPAPTATRSPQTAEPEAPAGPTAEPTKTPVVTTSVPAAGRVGGYFGYGIQAHIYGGDAQIYGLIQGMGFNWIKQQVEWSRVEPGSKGNYQWGDLDRIVNGASAAGLRVLLSVVKAPAWARGGGADLSVEGPPVNPQDFADFLSALATRYRGRVQAYEVWNEQNLHYEWGNEPISASRYVELLRVSYIAIKNADAGAVVVSGAPTPTGMNDGVIAIDDRAYLEQMYQAGLARWCDAVGVHPSGYNNPPDADWRSYNDPTAPTFKGHPSFFFRGTMEGYRNIMVKYGDSGKRLWPTEFGWSTFENLGAGAPAGYEYANNNTEGEQAAYLVQAFQMARNWGWVGPMFVWNLNFAPVAGPGDEKAGFGIVRSDWSPRPAYSALQSMAK